MSGSGSRRDGKVSLGSGSGRGRRGEAEGGRGQKGKQRICGYFNTPKGCSKGDSCTFRHVRPGEAGKPQRSKKPKVKKEKVMAIQKKVVPDHTKIGSSNLVVDGRFLRSLFTIISVVFLLLVWLYDLVLS